MSDILNNDFEKLEILAMYQIHARALACHCECLAMNAENCNRATLGQSIAYDADAYIIVMRKWGMIDENNQPSV